MLDFILASLPRRIKDWFKPYLSHDFQHFLIGMPSQLENVAYNRALWNRYAKVWDRKSVPLDNPEVGDSQRSTYLALLGDEWGRKNDVEKIVAEYIYPYITPDSLVAEIGVGGGRIASRVAGKVRELYAFDISKKMLGKARTALVNYSNVKFILIQNPVLPDALTGKCDFIYSFDVFVHLDVHMIWQYFVQIYRALNKGGHAFIHTTNLKAPGGWEHFSMQDKFSVAGHYHISPEIIAILAEHCGLSITKTSTPDPTNFYLNRDYLFVMQKRA